MAYEQAIQALADPTRREIFERLRGGPQAVVDLADGLHVSRPAVSQHLKVLEGAGLVRARREGTRRIYRVEVQGLHELRRYLERFSEDVLEAFRTEAERAPSRAETADRRRRSATPKKRSPARRKHGQG